MHERIISNPSSFRHSSFVIRRFPTTFRAPNGFGRPFHLSRPALAGGLISERGRKDRQLNEQRAERGVSERSGTNNKCQEPLMRRPAVRDANASSNPPKVIAVADQTSSVTPKTQP